MRLHTQIRSHLALGTLRNKTKNSQLNRLPFFPFFAAEADKFFLQ